MRNPLIDNAKGVWIFLVVLGHYLEAVGGWDNLYLGAILSIIYLFHMPAFVFFGGYGQERPSWRTDSKPRDYFGGFPVRLCCSGGHLRR